jgi:hypothetical protein
MKEQGFLLVANKNCVCLTAGRRKYKEQNHDKRMNIKCQWRRCLRRGSEAARLLGSWLRIPPGACLSVSFECCVLSGTGLCVGLITRPGDSYRVWCVWMRSWSLDNEETLAHWGLLRHWKRKWILQSLRLTYEEVSKVTDLVKVGISVKT